MAMGRKQTSTISSCLAALGFDPTHLSECFSVNEEFKIIKRAYYDRAKVVHPDKGGDAASFRAINEAFEVIRSLYSESKVKTFRVSSDTKNETQYETDRSFEDNYFTPSWDFYAQAAEETVPLYCVEPARSGRSQCKQKGAAKKCPMDDAFIKVGEIRIGSLDKDSGSYTRWNHLKCWRVPHKIWLAFPQEEPEAMIPESKSNSSSTALDHSHTTTLRQKIKSVLASLELVLLIGFNQLSEAQKDDFTNYCMSRSNWASYGKKTNVLATTTKELSSGVSTSKAVPVSMSTFPAICTNNGNDQLVASSIFRFPVPGRDADPNSLMGKTIVLTGLFPEIGGGAGLNLGKERFKGYLEGFGAKVTSSVSGRTDILIVGKEPGASKVAQARATSKCKIMTLEYIKDWILGLNHDDMGAAVKITNYSSGYKGNSLLRIGANPHQKNKTTNSIECHQQEPQEFSQKKPNAATKRKARQTEKDNIKVEAKANVHDASVGASARTGKRAKMEQLDQSKTVAEASRAKQYKTDNIKAEEKANSHDATVSGPICMGERAKVKQHVQSKTVVQASKAIKTEANGQDAAVVASIRTGRKSKVKQLLQSKTVAEASQQAAATDESSAFSTATATSNGDMSSDVAPGSVYYMEMHMAEDRQRFWSISVTDSNSTATTFGKVGSKGSNPSFKYHNDHASLVEFVHRQIQTWTKKGYATATRTK